MITYFGMSVFWWVFWLCLVLLFFVVATPVPRSTYRRIRQTPLERLQHRFANGEIAQEEYERRRAILLRDQLPPPSRPQPA
jgi:putative membrane protein